MSSSRIAKGRPMMTLTILKNVRRVQEFRITVLTGPWLQRTRSSVSVFLDPETNLRVPSQFGPQYLYVDMVVQALEANSRSNPYEMSHTCKLVSSMAPKRVKDG